MTQDLAIAIVEKPTQLALQDAISCFSDDAPEKSGEAITNAMLTIVGEACSLLYEGKTTIETIDSLKRNGLSEEISTTFVGKAIEIVQSNLQAENAGSSFGIPLLLAAGGLVLLIVLLVFLTGHA